MSQHILRGNLATALALAIEALEQRGMGQSAMCEGYRVVLQAIQDGKHIEVRR